MTKIYHLNRTWNLEEREGGWAFVNRKSGYERLYQTRSSVLQALQAHHIDPPPEVRKQIEALPESR